MNVMVYSETRGKFLGKNDGEWVYTTLSAKTFSHAKAAYEDVSRQTPKGKTETIVVFEFVNRQVVGLRELFTPAARKHYRKKVTEDANLPSGSKGHPLYGIHTDGHGDGDFDE